MDSTCSHTPSERPQIEAVSDLVVIAGGLKPKNVVVAGGDRPEDLRLVESARDHGIVERCILIGDGGSIRKAADEVGVTLDERDIIGTQSQEETAARVVKSLQDGTADIILKGNISTPILNREMVKIIVRNTMSLVTMFDTAPVARGRPMLLTDPGVTTITNFGRMVGLVENAVDVARSILQIDKPRVAILSANEKVIDSLPSTKMGHALASRKWDNAHVYGPLSFDLAVSEKSVALKGAMLDQAAREVAGRADILVCPSIDAANVLYKMIMETVEYGMGTFAGITLGVSCPYVILSRADNVETKLHSIALCSIACEYMDMAPAHTTAGEGGGASRSVLVVDSDSKPGSMSLFTASGSTTAEIPADGSASATAKSLLDEAGISALDAVAVASTVSFKEGEELSCGPRVLADRTVADAPGTDANQSAAAAIDIGAALSADVYVADGINGDLQTLLKLKAESLLDTLSNVDILRMFKAARRASKRSGTPINQATYVVVLFDDEITLASVTEGCITDAARCSVTGEQLRAAVENAAEESTALAKALHDIAGAIGSIYISAGPSTEMIILTGPLALHSEVSRPLKKRLGHLVPLSVAAGGAKAKDTAATVRELLADTTD